MLGNFSCGVTRIRSAPQIHPSDCTPMLMVEEHPWSTGSSPRTSPSKRSLRASEAEMKEPPSTSARMGLWRRKTNHFTVSLPPLRGDFVEQALIDRFGKVVGHRVRGPLPKLRGITISPSTTLGSLFLHGARESRRPSMNRALSRTEQMMELGLERDNTSMHCFD